MLFDIISFINEVNTKVIVKHTNLASQKALLSLQEEIVEKIEEEQLNIKDEYEREKIDNILKAYKSTILQLKGTIPSLEEEVNRLKKEILNKENT